MVSLLVVALLAGGVTLVVANPKPGTAAVAPALLESEPPPRGAIQQFRTDFSRHTISYREVLSGGPPKDGIPAIDNPRFVTVEEAAGWLGAQEPVVLVEVGEAAKAYPLQVLTWHEIVNDEVGGVPVSITFCPLCNTAIAFERTVAGTVLTFGTSGLVRNSDLVMWDRQTESLWQQIGGKALVGDMVGAELPRLPAVIVAWSQFRENFPEGIVLSRETGFQRDYGRNPYVGYDAVDSFPFLFRGAIDERLSPFERVATVEFGEAVVAYPFALLEQERVLEEERDGQGVVVFWVPGASSALDSLEIDQGRAVGSTGVFYREVDGAALSFLPNPADEQTFLDTTTRSVWNVFGEAISGPLEGSRLTAKVHANHFWFAWAAFQPETEIVTRGAN